MEERWDRGWVVVVEADAWGKSTDERRPAVLEAARGDLAPSTKSSCILYVGGIVWMRGVGERGTPARELRGPIVKDRDAASLQLEAFEGAATALALAVHDAVGSSSLPSWDCRR